MSTLTRKEDWDQGYVSRQEIIELGMGWRNYTNEQIREKIEQIGLDGKNVLEIGAGDSQWLPYLAQKYPGSNFCGLDYSEAGCRKLAERAAALGEGSSIGIYQQDMFSDDVSLHGTFDVAISFGVVEHFTDLSEVLIQKRKFLKDDGILFSLIPNLAGTVGFMTRSLNKDIYDTHNPHDWNSFREGHHRAGLTIIEGGYLGSTNYGVLTSCIDEQKGLSWQLCLFLTRLSKSVWYLESKVGNLPATRAFSPYIYAISRPG
jgi:2-polyprenyl-3-methyl-5-hydroxy-6-metoxy-1,4-benzoquinol methylase